MSGHREYELKFTIDPAATERLVAHPKIRPALRDRQVGRLVSTYFDTPDSTLLRHRFGLRVRRGHDRVTHTLKQTGGSLVDRGEWERTDTASHPNVAWLRETPVAPLLDDDAIASALGPRFTVEVTRTVLPVRHKGTRIEAAIDQGVIRSKGLSLPLNELELEVKGGRPDDALGLARILARDLPILLSLASKSERGYGVSDLSWGRPDEAITPALRPRMTIAQAFETIVQACLHTLLKNAALILSDQDRDAVHKARIALRHLRGVVQLFRPALRRRPLKVLFKSLTWLSRKLGDARDADVFQAAFFDPAAAENHIVGASSLADVMETERIAAHGRLRAALASPRARLLFVDMLALSTNGVRRRMRRKRFRPFVRKALGRSRRAIADDARGMRHKSSADMHEVRKAAKMLRYNLDIFAPISGLGTGKATRRFGKQLRVLQKSLGSIQDEVAMRQHVDRVFGAIEDSSQACGKHRAAAAPAAAHMADRKMSHGPALRKAAKAGRRLRALA